MSRIVIIGGGISGLSLAYRLEQQLPQAEVLVLEQRSQVGGNIHTAERDGFRIEEGPNGFLDNKTSTLGLCRDLELGDRLEPASEAAGRNRFLFLGGRLRLLPRGLWSFLFSGVLSWRAKLRILTERWRSPRLDTGDESIDAFARRRVGGEVAETLADAFVTGIYAGDPSLLSIQATFPRLAALEQEHGSVLRGLGAARKQRRAEAASQGQSIARNRMWSFREGLQVIPDSLRQRLRQPPLVGVAVRQIRRTNVTGTLTPCRSPGYLIQGEGNDHWTADRVVLACPAYQQAQILGDLDVELGGKIAEIPYNRIAVVALGYRAGDVPLPLEGFGYLSPQRQRRDVLGVQWCSSIFSGRAPAGLVLLRALCGGWNRPEIVDWDEEQMLSAVRAELGLAMGIKAEPVFHHIVRWDRAIPQYHVGHLERVAWIEQRQRCHPGLYLGGNAYRGVALNDCVEQAGALARQIAGDCGY